MATISIGSSFNNEGVGKAQRDLDVLKSKIETTSSKLGKIGKVGFGSLSVFVGGAAAFAVGATTKLEDANVLLENSFKNAGTSVEAHKDKLDKVQQKMEKFGYSGDQTRATIARMATVTGSADKALQSVGLAADIAKNRHVELDKAGDMLAKTMAGNTTAAKKMGIAIPESVQKIQDPAQKSAAIMQILQDRFKGSAEAAGSTFGGKMEAAKAQITDTAAKIGQKLIPMVMKVVDGLMKLGKWITSHKEVMIGILVAIGLALGTMAVMWVINTIAAMAFWTAATGGIILLVGAVVAGVLYMWTHFSWFRNAIKAIWHGIMTVIQVVWGIIKIYFKAIVWYIKNVLVPVFMAIWDVVKTVFGVVIDIISGAWDKIKGVFKWIKDGIKTVINIFGSIVSGIGDAFSTLGDIILSPFKWAFNEIAKIWNGTVGQISFKTPSWLGPLGNKGFSIPKIPEWKAKGGSVMGGNPYIVGEQGPELFVPGSSGTIVPNHRLGGGGGTVIQNITITSNDPQQVVNALIRYQQRNGVVPIRTAA